jgi:aldehyde:ferredoxin oxidoreductase
MVREGRTRADDTLDPSRFGKAVTQTDVTNAQGAIVTDKKTNFVDPTKLEGLKDLYYAQRGWDLKTGIPTRAKLESLGMKDVADGLAAIGKLPA